MVLAIFLEWNMELLKLVGALVAIFIFPLILGF